MLLPLPSMRALERDRFGQAKRAHHGTRAERWSRLSVECDGERAFCTARLYHKLSHHEERYRRNCRGDPRRREKLCQLIRKLSIANYALHASSHARRVLPFSSSTIAHSIS